jgi:hypothetical protein
MLVTLSGSEEDTMTPPEGPGMLGDLKRQLGVDRAEQRQTLCSKISGPTITIQRSFRDLSAAEVGEIEQASVLVRVGWPGSFGWDELLRSDRVLIVSEAGAGKTYECQAQQVRLWKAGEPAFFLDLATLAGSSVRDMFSQEEVERFEAWLRSQSEVATFFLDSIDELKLTLGKFDQALKRLNRALAGQLGRARIVVTTRPVPVDRELIVRHLPIPASAEAESTAEAFADMVMDRGKKKPADVSKPKAWRNVGLLPLSSQQIRMRSSSSGMKAAMDSLRTTDWDAIGETLDYLSLSAVKHRKIPQRLDDCYAGCLGEDVGIMAGVPQKAADLLHRASGKVGP